MEDHVIVQAYFILNLMAASQIRYR